MEAGPKHYAEHISQQTAVLLSSLDVSAMQAHFKLCERFSISSDEVEALKTRHELLTKHKGAHENLIQMKDMAAIIAGLAEAESSALGDSSTPG